MLRKISIVLSAIAALGLAVAVSAPADAKPAKNVHVNKTVHVNRTVNVHRNVTVNRRANTAVRGRFTVGQRYNGHVWYGHNRHRWHGVWYGYGIGPCWINVDGEWFWNDVACP